MKNILLPYMCLFSIFCFSETVRPELFLSLPISVQKTLFEVEVKIEDTSQISLSSLCHSFSKKDYFNLARYNKKDRTITIDRSVIEAISSKNQDECLNKTQYEIAQQLILEAYAIAFDRLNIKLGVEAEFDNECENTKVKKYRRKLGPQKSFHSRVPYLTYSKSCREFKNTKRSLSRSPYFLTLTGWVDHGIIFKRKKNHNQFKQRSLFKIEWESRERSFSVNFAQFILDKEFKCRRPTLYRYFERVFTHSPKSKCKMNYYAKLSPKISPLEQRKSSSGWVDLNPKRLYQVHYLFAGTGEQLMSKWGHSMFRLVYCRPGRKVGPDCLKDIGYHIVLSYRANVDDTQIDYLKGLSGDYESRLYLETLIDIINEYNKSEYREVTSLPIKLSNNEKEIFVERALEQFWSYRGKYYFVSQNCAHEAMNLLRMAKQDHLQIQTKDILASLGMNNELIQMEIFDDSVLEDINHAKNKTFFFPSHAERLKRAIEHLKSEKIIPANLKWTKYFKQSLGQRKHFWEKAQDKKSIAQLIFLEEQSLLLQLKEIASQIGSFVNKKDSFGIMEMMQIDQLQRRYEMLMPQNHLVDGYGIPLFSENSSIVSELESIEKSDLNLNSPDLKEILRNILPKEIDDYEKTLAGRKFLLEKFAQLINGTSN